MYNKPNIVLLAGGTGERIWPISNYSNPKQFIKIPILNLSTFQLALKRSLYITSIDKIAITTNFLFHKIVKHQIEELGINFNNCSVSYEAEKQDTARVIFNYCLNELKQGRNFNIIFFPTDHLFFDEKLSFKDIKHNISWDKLNILVEKAEKTCQRFGYLYPQEMIKSKYFKVAQFIEKPYIEDMKNKNLYRNTGIYLAKPSVIIDEAHKLYSNLLPKNISIDKAITEKSDNIYALQVELDWEDIGNLDSIYKYFPNIALKKHQLPKEEVAIFNKKSRNFFFLESHSKFTLKKSIKLDALQ